MKKIVIAALAALIALAAIPHALAELELEAPQQTTITKVVGELAGHAVEALEEHAEIQDAIKEAIAHAADAAFVQTAVEQTAAAQYA